MDGVRGGYYIGIDGRPHDANGELFADNAEQAVTDEGINLLPLSDMTVAEIEQAVTDEGVNAEMLTAWMEEEEAGKNRSGAISVISQRLSEFEN